MIRYKYSPDEICQRIDAAESKWRDKAKEATAKLHAGDKIEASIWSDVKPVYMRMQQGKCAFCESLLGEEEDFDKIKQDVEHFRPKNDIKPWPTPALRAKLKLVADLPESAYSAHGYTFLAYHVLNYASSCKTCNSTLKGSHFPTRHQPDPTSRDPVELNQREQPYLINPVGDYDIDPESAITFIGLVPAPAAPATAPEYARARVTIAFFGLGIREDLLFGRALLLDQIGDKYRLLQLLPEADRVTVLSEIETLTRDGVPHANCGRSFVRLMREFPERAAEVLSLTKRYLATMLNRPQPPTDTAG